MLLYLKMTILDNFEDNLNHINKKQKISNEILKYSNINNSLEKRNINNFIDITNLKGPISYEIVSFLNDINIDKLSNLIDNLLLNSNNLFNNNNINELYNSIKPIRYKENINKYIENNEIIISFDNISKKIYLWSNKSGDCLTSINIPIEESFDITSLEISSNYKYIICYLDICSTEKKKIIIISIQTFKYLKLNNYNNTIISNCGLRSFNITNNNNLSIMNLIGTKVYAELECNNKYNNIITSNNNLMIYISNSSIDFINLEKKFINNIKFDNENFKYCKFSNDKKKIIMYSQKNNTVKIITNGLWKKKIPESKKEQINDFMFSYNHKDVVSMNFSNNSKFVASISKNSKIRVWDIIDKKIIYSCNYYKFNVTDIYFSNNDKKLILISNNKNIDFKDFNLF